MTFHFQNKEDLIFIKISKMTESVTSMIEVWSLKMLIQKSFTEELQLDMEERQTLQSFQRVSRELETTDYQVYGIVIEF